MSLLKKNIIDKSNKVGIIVLCIVVAVISFIFAFRNTDLSLSNKKVIKIILDRTPTVDKFRSRMKFYEELEILARGESVKYKIENFEFKACDYKLLLDSIKPGDSLLVWIDARMTLERKYLQIIRVYQLDYKSTKYVNIEYRNNLKDKQNKSALFVGAFCIFVELILVNRGVKVTIGQLILLFAALFAGIYRLTT